MIRYCDISVLIGAILSDVKNVDDEQIIFTLRDGSQYKMYHDQDCCETVMVDDITGDLADLAGSPITMAEEVTSENVNPPGVIAPEDQESFTWTFYKLATLKGYVTIRWYGESNGCYSESVDFEKMRDAALTPEEEKE